MPGSDRIQPCLNLRLLGPFKVFIDGVPIDARRWPRRKMKLLVKLLALQPQHQMHRERIQEMLWPELDAESAANNLYKTIHLVRHALEPDLGSGTESRFIITQGQQVLLGGPGSLRIDVDEFEQASAEALRTDDSTAFQAALALYEGECQLSGCDKREAA